MDKLFDSFVATARSASMPNASRRIARENLLIFLKNESPFDSRIVELAQTVSLPRKEKAMRRKALQQFMLAGEEPAPQTQSIGFFTLVFLQLPAIAIVLALFVTAGGGAAFAAEFALPGDFLYSVKVSVVEPIRTQLAFTSQAKAEWQVRRIDRRMREAEKLARRGKLTPRTRAILENRIEEHVVDLEERLEVLQENEHGQPASVHTELVQTLEQHEETMPHDQSGAIILTELGRLMVKTIEEVEKIEVPEPDLPTKESVASESSSSSLSSQSSEPSSSSESSVSSSVRSSKSSEKLQSDILPISPIELPLSPSVVSSSSSSSEKPMKVILKPDEPIKEQPQEPTDKKPVEEIPPVASSASSAPVVELPEPTPEPEPLPEPTPFPPPKMVPDVENNTKGVPQRVSPQQTIYIEIMN